MPCSNFPIAARAGPHQELGEVRAAGSHAAQAQGRRASNSYVQPDDKGNYLLYAFDLNFLLLP